MTDTDKLVSTSGAARKEPRLNPLSRLTYARQRRYEALMWTILLSAFAVWIAIVCASFVLDLLFKWRLADQVANSASILLVFVSLSCALVGAIRGLSRRKPTGLWNLAISISMIAFIAILDAGSGWLFLASVFRNIWI
jgi:uncharacterized membrane protein